MVIFDLDGTLCPQRAASTAPFERRLLPGVREKCAELRTAGHVLAIATNQGGARRGRAGRLTFGAVLAQLRWLRRELGVTACKFATRPPRGKPSPLMLIELMSDLGVTAKDTTFVGDSESDKQATQAAGVRFVHANDFFNK